MTATSVRPSTCRSTTPPAEYSRVATTRSLVVSSPSAGTPEILKLRLGAEPVGVPQLRQEFVHLPRAHHGQQPLAVRLRQAIGFGVPPALALRQTTSQLHLLEEAANEGPGPT